MGVQAPLSPPPRPALVLAALLGLLAPPRVLRALQLETLPAPLAAPPPGLLPDVNRAPASQLLLLQGVGPARAQAIVALRAEEGPFESLDGLERVHGIGPKTVAGLLDRARAGGPAPPPGRGAGPTARKEGAMEGG